ncbi:MAG: HipA domain-containing protein [Gammaproteobacteria bacterium]|nr:HipA domain-containing protein [Gammaproteobacteria bacterium]
MRICPITYESIRDDRRYSERGLNLLSPKLKNLSLIQLTADELRKEAIKRANKMSIQGVQPKLSAILSIKNESFKIVDSFGKYILKPEHQLYSEVPQNEDLTMRLAACIGIEVPLHGLLYGVDGSFTYFIKRFDRLSQVKKLSVEDFSQLSEHTRSTKYDSSMEKVVSIVDQFTTFPLIEKVKLFTRTVFNFLIGNEDMHLKNFSLITRNNKVGLSPAYDFLSSSIILSGKEELALPLNGKKSNIRRKDIIDYFGKDRMGLNEKIVESELAKIKAQLPEWNRLIDISFLSADMKQKYLDLLSDRVVRLF